MEGVKNSVYFSFRKLSCMRKVPAMILLILFTTMQYGKLLSYWNCKVTNSSDPKAVQCDCEKILTDTGDEDDATLLARVSKTEIIQEYYGDASVLTERMSLLITKIFFAPEAFFGSQFTHDIFSPPRQ